MNHRTTSVVVRALALVLASSTALLGACASDPSFTRIILVRHGEKAVDGTKDPDLSDVGRARANRLAAMTREAGVAALFASQFKRTQETVAPLAAATGLPVTAIDAGDPKALAQTILRDFGGKVVVVAAHSNTIPAIIAALGGPPLAELADDAYDELFVVITDRREPGASGHTEVVHLRYAVTTTTPSPPAPGHHPGPPPLTSWSRMSAWALDLGTTNTGLATWDPDARRPRFVHLDAVSRVPAADGDVAAPTTVADPMEAPRLVPSATHLTPPTGFVGRLGTWRPFRRRLWGAHGFIGRPALELNVGQSRREFAPTFKAALMRSPYKPLAHLGRTPFTARDVARVYLRELLRATKAATGERPRDLVITTPVDAYETYRAELLGIGADLGLGKLRFLDEPVAAAIGYGLGISGPRTVLVLDMGGGTAHAAVVRLDRDGFEKGSCEVLGKAGRQLGGNLVDRWLAEEFCRRLDYPLRADDGDEAVRFWWRLIVDEARRVKEAVYFKTKDAFYLTPPEDMRAFEARVRGDAQLLEVTLDDVRQILTQRGYYDDITRMIDEALALAGTPDGALSDVLMVGGSTLLPNIYGMCEARFGRDKVRAWQPFEAIAYGAAVFAAGELTQSDVIVHDYAFVTYDPKTNDRRHTVVIPRGTRVPTAPELWRRQVVPTCALGEPERVFKLVICEIGQAEPNERRFAWDESGQLHKLGSASARPASPAGAPAAPPEQIIVALNEKNPTLGELDPAHPPGDKTPRLDIAFAVNAERWLVATVRDLKTARVLMDEKPVVRLV